MELDWGVLFAIVAVAALLQMAFFWYYFRTGQGSESVYPKAAGDSGDNSSLLSGNQAVNGQQTGESDGDGEPVLTCSSCGHDNEWDPAFKYCANCVEQLGS